MAFWARGLRDRPFFAPFFCHLFRCALLARGFELPSAPPPFAFLVHCVRVAPAFRFLKLLARPRGPSFAPSPVSTDVSN
jgi:hypothetical protein